MDVGSDGGREREREKVLVKEQMFPNPLFLRRKLVDLKPPFLAGTEAEKRGSSGSDQRLYSKIRNKTVI